MKERNRNTLRDALGKLPEHTPPADVWPGLQRELTPKLVEQLPSYQPPAAVWNSISDDLARSQVQSEGVEEQRSATIRKLPVKWLSIAATLLLVVTVGYGIASQRSGPSITYAYSQEPAPAAVDQDWGEEESSFNNVLAQLETRNEPELNTLRMELTELTEAKEEVQAMLVAYGEDPGVVRQLAAIERDRSDVYRRIIVRL